MSQTITRYTLEQLHAMKRGGDLYNMMEEDIRRWMSLVVFHYKQMDWHKEDLCARQSFTTTGGQLHVSVVPYQAFNFFCICYNPPGAIPNVHNLWQHDKFYPIPRRFVPLIWALLPGFLSGAAICCQPLKEQIEDFLALDRMWPELSRS